MIFDTILFDILGVGLALVVGVLGITALFVEKDLECYFMRLMRWYDGKELNRDLLIIPKLLLAFPFFYHAVNGIRHLLWDLGLFFQLYQVKITGCIMLIITLLLTGYYASLAMDLNDAKKNNNSTFNLPIAPKWIILLILY